MTTTDNELDLTILEDMEFSPACEYSAHAEYSRADLPAEWIVRKRPVPCGCDIGGLVLWCTACLEQRKRLIAIGGFVYCIQCNQSAPASGSLISIERISGKSSE